MENLLLAIVRGLVAYPDDVKVKVDDSDENGVSVYNLQVHSEDMGRIIGKQGRIINSIRIVMQAAAAKNSCKLIVKVS